MTTVTATMIGKRVVMGTLLVALVVSVVVVVVAAAVVVVMVVVAAAVVVVMVVAVVAVLVAMVMVTVMTMGRRTMTDSRRLHLTVRVRTAGWLSRPPLCAVVLTTCACRIISRLQLDAPWAIKEPSGS
jgi:hypothetical protein